MTPTYFITAPPGLAQAAEQAASEVIVRMAKAVAEKRGQPWAEMKKARQRKLINDARAALSAIVEPHPALIAATAYMGTEQPVSSDWSIAALAETYLPKTGHPDTGDILAELARDWRMQMELAVR